MPFEKEVKEDMKKNEVKDLVTANENKDVKQIPSMCISTPSPKSRSD